MFDNLNKNDDSFESDELDVHLILEFLKNNMSYPNLPKFNEWLDFLKTSLQKMEYYQILDIFHIANIFNVLEERGESYGDVVYFKSCFNKISTFLQVDADYNKFIIMNLLSKYIRYQNSKNFDSLVDIIGYTLIFFFIKTSDLDNIPDAVIKIFVFALREIYYTKINLINKLKDNKKPE